MRHLDSAAALLRHVTAQGNATFLADLAREVMKGNKLTDRKMQTDTLHCEDLWDAARVPQPGTSETYGKRRKVRFSEVVDEYSEPHAADQNCDAGGAASAQDGTHGARSATAAERSTEKESPGYLDGEEWSSICKRLDGKTKEMELIMGRTARSLATLTKPLQQLEAKLPHLEAAKQEEARQTIKRGWDDIGTQKGAMHELAKLRSRYLVVMEAGFRPDLLKEDLLREVTHIELETEQLLRRLALAFSGRVLPSPEVTT